MNRYYRQIDFTARPNTAANRQRPQLVRRQGRRNQFLLVRRKTVTGSFGHCDALLPHSDAESQGMARIRNYELRPTEWVS